MSTETNWLQITESVSIVASGVGTIAAAVYGQAAMAAVPITAALAVNFASRQRLREQIELDTRKNVSELGRVVELMRQEVEKLPKQQPDVAPITESILRLQELSLSLANRQEELGQQFQVQTRSEIQTIAELEKTNSTLKEQISILNVKIDNVPIPIPVDLSGIEGKTEHLQTELEILAQQFNSRPEVAELPKIQQEASNAVQQVKQEITYLRDNLFAISQQFDDRIELQALPEIQQETSEAISRLDGLETEINDIGENLSDLSAQFSNRPEIAALPQIQQETNNAVQQIEGKIGSLREELLNLTKQFENRLELQTIPEIQQGTNNAIAQLQQTEKKIADLGNRISLLPKIQDETKKAIQKIEKDFNNLRDNLQSLAQKFDSRPEIGSLPKIQQETNRSLQQIEEKISNIRTQLDTINTQFVNRQELASLSQLQKETKSAILKLDKLIEGEINYTREQMSALTEYFNNRPEITELPQLRQENSDSFQNIAGEISKVGTQLTSLSEQFNARAEVNEVANLRNQLETLYQQFKSRPEIEAIANLEASVNALLEPPKLSNWPGVKIKAIGIGESGKSAIGNIISNQLTGIDFWLVDSDSQTLELLSDVNKLQVGESLTQGKGTGGDTAIAKIAVEESRQQIEAAIQPSDLVFIIAGMGGGMGTGIAPIIAEIAKEIGALTVGIVSVPFVHEGRNRAILAEEGIAALQEKTDMLVVIPIDKVFSSISEWTPIEAAFQVVNDLELQAVQGICNIINNRGLVNVDFADLKQAIATSGLGGIGIGKGTGKSRAKIAAMAAISSPLMQLANQAAKTVILSIDGPSNLSVQEVNEVAQIIKEFVGEKANIMLGAGIDERLVEEVRVSAIATGLVS